MILNETVESYLKYRPSYPEEVYSLLVKQFNLAPDKVIADIGSGTSFLSKLFLAHSHTVYGVEPNSTMRMAAEKYLSLDQNFYSVNGLAEATTLGNEAIDWVIVGTAFHWFDAKKTKSEFKRILKSPGFCLLVWNVRNKQQSAFLQDYEDLILCFSKDYQHSPAQAFNQAVVEDFFIEMQTASLVNKQKFSWEGLQGRLLSTSYSLRENDFKYSSMMNELKQIFDRHQSNGFVEFLYATKMYYGQMK